MGQAGCFRFSEKVQGQWFNRDRVGTLLQTNLLHSGAYYTPAIHHINHIYSRGKHNAGCDFQSL